jgi:hypothetical protein
MGYYCIKKYMSLTIHAGIQGYYSKQVDVGNKTFMVFFSLYTIFTPEIDCNKTALGLPPITSAVFLIAN